MFTTKFVIGQVAEKIHCNDFNEGFEIDSVKNEPNEIDMFTKGISSTSRRETDFEDHKYVTDNHGEQNEELDAKNLDPKKLYHSKFLENLSSTCNPVGIKNEDIDIFYEDIKRETGEEKPIENIGFCKDCCQNFGDETDIFKSTSYRSECSCPKQNESLLYNIHGEDLMLDVKPSFLHPPTGNVKDSTELKALEVQDDMISEEVTRERDTSAVPHRLSVFPAKNGNEMKCNLSPEPLENVISVAKKITFHCKICSKSFSQKSTMKIHVRSHAGETPFCCKICSKPFTTSSDLKAHGKIHTGEKPFCCKICFKVFATSGYLKHHGRVHTEEKFQCKICPKAFTTSRYLKEHCRLHTKNLFNCKSCSKSFIRKESLRNHERVHTGEKPFNCKLCTKSFSQRGNLNVHVKLHVDETFSCKICSKSFTTLLYLKRHERYHIAKCVQNVGSFRSFERLDR